jgi:hypothetical protein
MDAPHRRRRPPRHAEPADARGGVRPRPRRARPARRGSDRYGVRQALRRGPAEDRRPRRHLIPDGRTRVPLSWTRSGRYEAFVPIGALQSSREEGEHAPWSACGVRRPLRQTPAARTRGGDRGRLPPDGLPRHRGDRPGHRQWRTPHLMAAEQALTPRGGSPGRASTTSIGVVTVREQAADRERLAQRNGAHHAERTRHHPPGHDGAADTAGPRPRVRTQQSPAPEEV